MKENRYARVLATLLCWGLGACGPDAVPTPRTRAQDAFDALAEPDFSPVVRTRLAELAVAIPEARTSADRGGAREIDQTEVRALVELFVEGGSARWESVAVEAARELGAGAVPVLEGLMGDGSLGEAERAAAATLLASVGTVDALDGLIVALEGASEPWLRSLCARLLGESGDDRFTLRLLMRLKYETDEETVIRLAEALGAVGDHAGLDGLLRLSRSEVDAIATLASGRLEAVVRSAGVATVDELTAAWNTPLPLPAFGMPPSLPLQLATWRSIAELSSEHFQLRGVDDARFVLSRLPAWAAGLLAEALRDEDPHLRLHSVQVLERMGPRAQGAGDALMASLADPRIAHAAAEALGRVGYTPARALLEAATRADRPHELRVAAIRAMGQLGESASVPRLVQVQGDPGEAPDSRMAAAEALVELGEGGRVVEFLVAEMLGADGDARAAELALEGWLELEARSGDAVPEAVLREWRALEGPPALVITPDQVDQRRRERARVVGAVRLDSGAE